MSVLLTFVGSRIQEPTMLWSDFKKTFRQWLPVRSMIEDDECYDGGEGGE